MNDIKNMYLSDELIRKIKSDDGLFCVNAVSKTGHKVYLGSNFSWVRSVSKSGWWPIEVADKLSITLRSSKDGLVTSITPMRIKINNGKICTEHFDVKNRDKSKDIYSFIDI